MSQVSRVLRSVDGGYAHWCPGCHEIHRLPSSWSFNGDLDSPTFTPSFLHSGIRREFKDGNWTGSWVKDSSGGTVPFICHYIISSGMISFQNDCTHSLVSSTVLMPELPDGFKD